MDPTTRDPIETALEQFESATAGFREATVADALQAIGREMPTGRRGAIRGRSRSLFVSAWSRRGKASGPRAQPRTAFRSREKSLFPARHRSTPPLALSS